MFTSSILPAVVEKHLDCIKYWEDGRLVLGSSGLTGRYWNGSLWCFQQAEDAPNIEKCITGIETESGISDLLCLKDNRVVVGLDSGTVELYQLENEPVAVFGNLSYACEHDDVVASLSSNVTQTHIVSGSYDKCIKVWDVEAWCSISTYRPAHESCVWQVSFSTCEPQVFMSCSQDGKIMLWDLRLPKPATILNKSPMVNIPTAVAWQPQSSTVYAAGDDGGHIVVKDFRGTGNVLEYQAHRRGVFRLAFCPQNPLWLASCADDSSVTIVEMGKDSVAHFHQDNIHSDFVRGLTWSPDSALVTCGWDKKVLKHAFSPCDMEVASPDSSMRCRVHQRPSKTLPMNMLILTVLCAVLLLSMYHCCSTSMYPWLRELLPSNVVPSSDRKSAYLETKPDAEIFAHFGIMAKKLGNRSS